jgi:hypothetical protein
MINPSNLWFSALKVSDLWRFCLRKSRLHRMKSQKQCGIGKLVPETDSISISGEPWWACPSSLEVDIRSRFAHWKHGIPCPRCVARRFVDVVSLYALNEKRWELCPVDKADKASELVLTVRRCLHMTRCVACRSCARSFRSVQNPEGFKMLDPLCILMPGMPAIWGWVKTLYPCSSHQNSW